MQNYQLNGHASQLISDYRFLSSYDLTKTRCSRKATSQLHLPSAWNRSFQHMGVSENRGPYYSTQNSRILICKDPKTVPYYNPLELVCPWGIFWRQAERAVDQNARALSAFRHEVQDRGADLRSGFLISSMLQTDLCYPCGNGILSSMKTRRGVLQRAPKRLNRRRLHTSCCCGAGYTGFWV